MAQGVTQIDTVKEDKQDTNVISMNSLLEAGVHFGHQKRRWNPKMDRFIFAQRNGIHIIDLQKTLNNLKTAAEFLTEVSSEGKRILMVGTKKQAQDTIITESQRSNSLYVTNRWLGGTLTNFKTIQSRIDHLVDLESRRDSGEFSQLSKRESLRYDEEVEKLNRNLSGLKEMTELPGALLIIDIGKEEIAVAEANRVGIPTVALVDSDCNPDLIDYPIPGNDDAIRSIRLIVGYMASAIVEGHNRRMSEQTDLSDDDASNSDTSPRMVTYSTAGENELVEDTQDDTLVTADLAPQETETEAEDETNESQS
mgnify:CR=1 FL=1